MKFENYGDVLALSGRPEYAPTLDSVTIHKDNAPSKPRISLILLDWECRERFHSLDWLHNQNVPKDIYELIWVELYNRVVPEVEAQADVLITCHQEGMYHKHKGYNVGLLKAKGEIIIVCDSDAVFPRDFISSVLISFEMEDDASPIPLVLMYHEWRTSFRYPDSLQDAEELKHDRWNWWPLVPNAGACVAIRRDDAIRFGGFDEHESLRGYLCGPYELGWRLVNAGVPEIWHDSSVALWHFAHPDPVAANGFAPSFARLRESTYPHVDMHAITAVEAFSMGRLLPKVENPDIWRQRLARRRVGSDIEEKYGVMTGAQGFSPGLIRRMKFKLRLGMLGYFLRSMGRRYLGGLLTGLLGPRRKDIFVFRMRLWLGIRRNNDIELVRSSDSHRLVRFGPMYCVFSQELGEIDLYCREDRRQPDVRWYSSCEDAQKSLANYGSVRGSE